MTARLFTPLELRGVRARNRLWVSPMCQYSAEDGLPGPWHRTHLGGMAAGGAGLVIAEAAAVLPEGRITPRDVGIWNAAQAEAWAPIAADVRARGAVPGIQLAHAGRKASTWWPWAEHRGSIPAADGGWTTKAPSAVAYEGLATPEELDAAGIDEVVAAFGAGARRAVDAGFEAVEIHAAHGYLIHEFLSPLSNRRADEYGGSLENRARLLRRVVSAVREAVGPERAVLVRFSGTDAAEGGWTIEDTVVAARWAAEDGADLIDVSSGGLVAHQRFEVGPGYQVPLAARVRAETGLPVATVGMITEPEQAEGVLRDGSADVVLAGREWLRDPHFGLRAADALGVAGVWPPQYERARRH